MPFHIHRATCWALTCCLSGLLTAPQVLADDPASQQLRDQQRGLQQLEQQQRLERWQRQPAQAKKPDTTAPLPHDQRCWAISGVRVAGNRKLSDSALTPTLRRFITPCMDIAEINGLLKAITQRYVQAGYPTSRPYLQQPPQDGAPLYLVIVEGFVESIELAGPDLPLSLSGAFPGLLGQPLYLPDLEQGLDQLNRLRAYELSAALLPGELQGGTRVVVQPRKVTSRGHLDSRFDNRGSDLTGRHRLNLGFGLDSPLGLNDDLRLSLNGTVLDAPGQSQGVSLYYSIPYGAWAFALSASELRYEAPLPHSRQVTDGNSSYQGLSVERVLWRNQQGMLSASARLDRKQMVNRSAGAVIVQQSPTLVSVEAGINLLWLEKGLWNGYLGLAQGIDAFGADRSPLGAERLRPDFRKYRANLLHLRQGPASQPWRWQSELALQYSSDPLPAVEQLLVSDDSAVRGFRLRTYSGASSAAWRNTVSQPLPEGWTAPLQVRPYIGLDLGWTRTAEGKPSQRLAGATAGAELSLPGSHLRLGYQRALYASDLPRPLLEPGFWVVELALNI
ncbi:MULTISPECIES: ShlB/FhaC/HecB family hemolysin secretion/activation protein [Pseudomonas]|uniref:ShlB/FhaC/HecB family hemolysin secretion/activation protein n=1 Tax=Pseudomonas TaxID=286 RepID=UPI0006280D19|nr:ShlB/FhaC/HecB family hemolysin secretion/activation protein [Pseudomonas putida]KKO14241.1 TPS family activation/secretion protein [Pseudomonas putida KG-4]